MFPRAVIPISIIASNFIHYLAALGLFLIPLSFLGTLSLASFPYMLCGIGLLILFTTGISLLTAALNVRYRDVNFFVQAILIIWFYATPIIYSLSQIPSHLLWLWRFNPLTSILQLMQHALIDAPLPGPAMLASNTLVIIIVASLGILVFRDESRNFDDWL